MRIKMSHIGIVVKNIDDLLDVLKRAFHAEEILRVPVPDQNQVSSIVRLADMHLELIESTSPNGPSGKHLKERGEGIHHISLLCENVPEVVKRLESLGIRMVGKHFEPGHQFAFVHPKSLNGLLLEVTNRDPSDRSSWPQAEQSSQHDRLSNRGSGASRLQSGHGVKNITAAEESAMEITRSAKRLEGQMALITGASRGIGRAIAVKFAQEGADLFLCATNMHRLEETASLVAQTGRTVHLHTVDVADREAVQSMVNRAAELFGHIDILVNNAGVYKASPFVDYTYEDFNRIIKVNLYGPFNVTQFVLKQMLKRQRGKIINIASTAGKWASINQSAYNMSKHAVVGMTRCLGLEMAKRGINVNAICPGVTKTDFVTSDFLEGNAAIAGITTEEVLDQLFKRVPMGRWLEPEEMASLALYLASSDSDGMTGQSILLDAGMLYV